METKCHLDKVINVIGGKWKLQIIWNIYVFKVIRYNELKRNVNGITNMMLSKSLKELEHNKIITRKQYEEIPPRVEYSLTSNGLELLTVLKELEKWGAKQ